MRDKGIRILLVSPLPPPAGGIASWTIQYLEWAERNNIDVEIINTSIIGKRCTQINSKRNFLDEIRRTIKIVMDLKKRISKTSLDVVHLNSSCAPYGIIRDYLCSRIVNKSGILLVLHYHCNIEDQIKNRRISKIFFQKLSRIADVNLVLNKSSQQYLALISGCVSKVVTNFIQDSFILNKEKHINSKIQKIIFVGHVKVDKGVVEIIEVAKTFPEIDFLLVGSVSNVIKNTKIPSNVILKGALERTEVKELLYVSDVFLFPTYSEGFSVALLEAMAMGLPIITTSVGANKDMIELKGGITVRKINVEDIVDAISKFHNKEYREKASIWNINKVRENYTIDIVMEKLISIYDASKL